MQVGDVPAAASTRQRWRAKSRSNSRSTTGCRWSSSSSARRSNELTDAIRRYHVMLPPPLALLLRVLVMLEGTGRLLAPDFNLVELLEPTADAAC